MATSGRGGSAEIIGLIPAAGLASRLAPLPCSKELLPLWFPRDASARSPRPVCLSLLTKMRQAGVGRAYLVLRDGKWDIPQVLGNGDGAGLRLAYLIASVPYGPPFSLDEAYPFIRHAVIAFGFPDILFEPEDVYARLLACHEAGEADVVLGLFPAHQASAMDMIEVDDCGRVRDLVIKPAHTHLRMAWICAVWSPAFTEFLHAHLTTVMPSRGSTVSTTNTELSVGHVLQAALAAGLRMEAVFFDNGRYLDIGTPEGMAQAEHWHQAATEEMNLKGQGS